jgi:hypothetical protein
MYIYTNSIPRASAGEKWFLLGKCSVHIRQQLVCEFGQYLFEDIYLLSDRVSQQISALKFCFLAKKGCVEGFASPQLSALRKGLSNQPLPKGWEPKSRLPTPLDQAMDVHSEYENSKVWEEKAKAVGIALGYCLLLCPSEYLTHTKHDRHVLKAGAVEFECKFADGRVQFVKSHRLKPMGVTWDMVQLVKVTVESAKNIRDRAGRVIWFTAHRPNNALKLPKILFEWSLIANHGTEESFFLSWLVPGTIMNSRETLKYADMQKTVKAVAVKFGFAPRRFGCHGLRVGGACLLRAAGASDGIIMLLGRWASLPACLKYQEGSTVAHDRALDCLVTVGLYTSRDVNIRYPNPECIPFGPKEAGGEPDAEEDWL